MAALRSILMQARPCMTRCIAVRSMRSKSDSLKSLTEVLQKASLKEIPRRAVWEEMSSHARSVDADDLIVLPTHHLVQLLDAVSLQRQEQQQPFGRLMRQLNANPERWVNEDNLTDAISLYAALFSAGYVSNAATERLAMRLMDAHHGMDVSTLARYSGILAGGRVDRILFNPWPWILACIETSDLRADFLSLFSYCLSSRQFTRQNAEQLVSEIKLELMPGEILPLFLRRFSRLAGLGGFWRLMDPMLEKAYPAVEGLASANSLGAVACAEVVRSLSSTVPPKKWLDMLMPTIYSGVTALSPSQFCALIYTLGKGMGRGGEDKVYVSHARRLLDAYSCMGLMVQHFSPSDLNLFCHGLSMLQLRHASYLHDIAAHLVDEESKLVAMTGAELCHVVEGMTLVNFVHLPLLEKVLELLDSGAVLYEHWHLADCLGVACALLHAQRWSVGLLEKISSASRDDIDKLYRLSFNKLAVLSVLVKDKPELSSLGLNTRLAAPIAARAERDPVRSGGDTLQRKREDRLLNMVESLLPHHSFLARFARASGVLPVHGALLLGAADKWAVSWRDAQLKPAAVSPQLLNTHKQLAVAVVIVGRTDTLGDALRSPCGAVLLRIAALKLAGWRVVTLSADGLAVAEGSSAIFKVRDALLASGVQLPVEQVFSMPATAIKEERQQQEPVNSPTAGDSTVKRAPNANHVRF